MEEKVIELLNYYGRAVDGETLVNNLIDENNDEEAVMKSGNYAYIGRKQKKRDFRRLWITRISAGAKLNGMNYSTFMNGLKKAGVVMNRKMLSELAIHDATAFTALTEKAKEALK